MKPILTILISILSTIFLHAQTHTYWIQLNTKTGTPYSLSEPSEFLSQRAIERRNRQNISIDSTDLPINPVFTDSIKKLGFEVKHTSKWMNGIIAEIAYDVAIDSLITPSFVDFYQLRKGTPTKSHTNKFELSDSASNAKYGLAFSQTEMLNGHKLHKYSRGKNIHVAVIDAGFENADIIQAFDSLYANNQILGTYDFVKPGNNVFSEHNHGTRVLSAMAGNIPNMFIGTAPDASYWLLRSEDAETEYPVEEDFWIIAAEFADSTGCDVINTSLGYSVFDDIYFNHTYTMYTGDSLRISQAANMAVDKGIVVVCSAGNEAQKPWKYIIAPAEAKNVLAVAAVDANKTIASFSSIGFSETASVKKPDVAALGLSVYLASEKPNESIIRSSGTSFASPIIAGMAACLVDIFPDKKAAEIIDLIRSSGNLYPNHSVEYGYGIPDFDIFADSTQQSSINSHKKPNIALYPNPFSRELIVFSNFGNAQFDVFDTRGIRVFSTNINGNRMQINNNQFANLKRGIYIVKISNNTYSEKIKLIKQ
jgi:subtilisin family serine protease